jgi:hypothetical protein
VDHALIYWSILIFIDLDVACFMMLARDLPALFGIMARLANRKVPVKDLSEFHDWLHVISDPIVVKVHVRSDEHEKAAFKDDLVNTLRRAFGMTLTCSPDSLTLSRNQVNVSYFGHVRCSTLFRCKSMSGFIFWDEMGDSRCRAHD